MSVSEYRAPSRKVRNGRNPLRNPLRNPMKTLKPALKTLSTGPRTLSAGPGAWRHGKTSAQRGYGYKWQQAREGYLRLHPLCVMCEAKDRTTSATVVDHIIPHRGDQKLFWDSGNWQPLCKSHHDAKTQQEMAAGM